MKKLICTLCLLAVAVTALLCAPIGYADTAAFATYKSTYQPNTGIIGAPTVILDVTDEETYAALNTEKTPAIAIYYVNDKLEVIAKDGKVIASLAEAISGNASVVPAIYVKNQTQANALISFTTQNSLIDAFVISDNGELVKAVRSATRGLLGAVDFSNTEIDGENLIEIRSVTQKSLAHVSILSFSLGSAETVDYLRHRLQGVWVKAPATKLGAYTVLATGAAGIVTENASDVIALIESFTEPTMFSTPLVIGHRGDATYGGENTITSALSAVEKGVEGVECDIQLTKDNRIVLMHDDTLNRTTNGTGRVDQMTLAEIQQYTVKSSTEAPPSLDDYLAALKGKNCVVYVEFKYNVPALVPYVKELIERLDMTDQIVFITFHVPVLQAVRQQIPEIPASYLLGNTSISGSFTSASVYNCGISPNYAGFLKETRAFLNARSINVNSFTYTDVTSFDNSFLQNHTSLTVDQPSYSVGYAAKAKTLFNKLSLYTEESKAYTLMGTLHNRLGDEIGVSQGFIVIESNTELITSPLGTYGTGDGYAYIAFYGTDSKLGYRVYSNPVPVTVGKGKLPSTDNGSDKPAQKGCGSSATVALPLLLVLSAFVCKRK
ncbi:MAG: glycerophosphodiester phosphodiesterase family protein [Clostridia bacterium]|nr:glycerophosphodiester phosphodiesterase family protein [Clostridia bacterium]